ncbi:uncharacterized protein CTRU02_202205 [Colletotrichum truncatum]|uniref:Uncharacterized protein n=1 Tax=Colletotrichum truncatum TaxID=5467 RepID=A0ACC3ZJN6_COLTU|nr:uncharacterized protein CTRU02_01367 [Colletotrichum truncatum]KAF6799688.1 hypothetical protein CTRU02_01367 [Colletotrichum truncatum]
MSGPPPVPSKAAIHALRGLLFGTSCSLVLLAEERRQRIKIARSAVENGRRLKSLKRYSSSGGAALEALHEEVRTDPNFVGWSNRSRSRSSSQEHRHLSGDSTYLDYVAHDLGPDPRRPTRQTREAKGRDASEPSLEKASVPTRHRRSASDAAKETSKDSSWSRFSRPDVMKHSVPAVGEVAKTRAYVSTPNKNAIASIINAFWKDNPLFREPEDLHHSFTPDVEQYTPAAALGIVRRAYNSTSSSRELPDWLIKLSSTLCIACQQEGHYDVAGQILKVIVSHGPLSLGDYLAHQPQNLIASLMSKDQTSRIESPSALTEYVTEVTELYVADIVDIEWAPYRVQQEYIGTGKDLICSALSLLRGKLTMGVWGRVYYMSRKKLPDTLWFLRQLELYREPTLGLDTFLTFYAKNNPRGSSKELSELAVNWVLRSRGYSALGFLDVMNQFRQMEEWKAPAQWVENVLWCSWTSSLGYEIAQKLISHVLENDFYDVDDSYAIRRTIVRICLEANDMVSAQSNFEELCSHYPVARNDVELRGAFANRKADLGDWDGVRADFEALKAMQPFPEDQRLRFNSIFVKVLQTYSKSHTWGETETFLATYVQELGVVLDRFLVTFIADRHGKCHDIKAMARWLKFCKEAGFHTDVRFWTTVLNSCKRDWAYTDQDMETLYNALILAGVQYEFPSIDRSFTQLIEAKSEATLRRVQLRGHRFSPADERKTFGRMLLEAQHENWSVVQSIYNRAVHNQMGFSGRCLRLMMYACVKINGPFCKKAKGLLAKAHSEGHDVGSAVVPVVEAKFDDVKRYQQNAATTVEGRGRPFPAIKRIVYDLRDEGIRIDDKVFTRAVDLCCSLRNYREAIFVCVLAAETNGKGDVCYNLNNFKRLVRIYTARHEYDKVRWLVSQLREREYRFRRPCIRALDQTIFYLQRASEAMKDEELRQSDRETLAFVRQVRDEVAKENIIVHAERKEMILESLTGGRPKTAVPYFKARFNDSAVPSLDNEQAMDMLREEEMQSMRSLY